MRLNDYIYGTNKNCSEKNVYLITLPANKIGHSKLVTDVTRSGQNACESSEHSKNCLKLENRPAFYNMRLLNECSSLSNHIVEK